MEMGNGVGTLFCWAWLELTYMASWVLIAIQGSFGQGLKKTMWNDYRRRETPTGTISTLELASLGLCQLIASWD